MGSGGADREGWGATVPRHPRCSRGLTLSSAGAGGGREPESSASGKGGALIAFLGAAQCVPLPSGPVAQRKGTLCSEGTGSLRRVLPSLFHNQRAWEGHRVSSGHVGVLVDLLQPPDAAGAGEQTLSALGAGGLAAPCPQLLHPQTCRVLSPRVHLLSCCSQGTPGTSPGLGSALGSSAVACASGREGFLVGLPCAIGWHCVTPPCGDRKRLCPPV